MECDTCVPLVCDDDCLQGAGFGPDRDCPAAEDEVFLVDTGGDEDHVAVCGDDNSGLDRGLVGGDVDRGAKGSARGEEEERDEDRRQPGFYDESLLWRGRSQKRGLFKNNSLIPILMQS